MKQKRYPFAEGSVLVTGTSTGIGHATVSKLSQAGFHVFAGVRKPADAQNVVSLANPALVTPVMMDVTEPDSVTSAAMAIRQTLESRSGFLAGVVSNAGVGMIAPTSYLNEDILHYQTQTNLLGPVRLAREFIPLMQETLQGRRRRGRFYFVGTGAGIPSLVFPFLNIYMACKWGTEAFCQSLRVEMQLIDAPIDIGMINPGFINTAMRSSTRNAVQGKLVMDAPFGQRYGKLIQKFGEFGDRQRGTSPDAVAEKILDMMMALTPRYRYRVGSDSLITYLLALTPLKVQELMIRKIYR